MPTILDVKKGLRNGKPYHHIDETGTQQVLQPLGGGWCSHTVNGYNPDHGGWGGYHDSLHVDQIDAKRWPRRGWQVWDGTWHIVTVEGHNWNEDDDIVYTDDSFVCSDCGRTLPLSYRRGDEEDRLLSMKLSARAHICPAETPDVIIVTAEGTVYSLVDYLSIMGDSDDHD